MAYTIIDERLKTLGKSRSKLSASQIAAELNQILLDQTNFQSFPLDNYLRHLSILCVKRLKNSPAVNEETEKVLEVIDIIIDKLSTNNELRRPLLTADSLLPSFLDLLTTDSTPLSVKTSVLHYINKMASMRISAEVRTGIRQKYERYFSRLVSYHDFNFISSNIKIYSFLRQCKSLCLETITIK